MEDTLSEAVNTIADAIVTRVKARLVAEPVTRNPEPRLLDVTAAALYLGRSEKAVRGMVAGGAVPVVRLDGRVQFDIRDLDVFIENSKDV